MNKLIEFFGRQGLFAELSTIFVLVVGIYSAFTIKRTMFPNVEYDIVTVTTIFPGASAEEVERLVTNTLEQELLEVDGVKKMTSVSMEARSFILLQLDPDQVAMNEGKTDVQDVIDRVDDLPEEAEDPLVVAFESKLEPVIQVSISSDRPEAEVRSIAKKLEREIETLAGVAKVEVDGSRDIEYRVEASPEKLRSYQLTLDDLIRALQFRNLNVPGGVLEGSGEGKDKKPELLVRTVGEFRDMEDVKNSVVRANVLGGAIRVSDVAEVTQSFEKAAIFQRTNGRGSMNLTVLKKESADAITVVDTIKKRMEEMKPRIPEGVFVSYVNDSSYYIRRRLDVLSGNLIIGLALVVLVLSLVMPWRVSLVTAVGMPFAFLGSLYVMDQFDISFNVISMMGLIIVVGMLVDDAIVVTENVVRHMESGVPAREAAVRGTQEIWAPVVASVTTTMMAFIPMMVMSGVFGKFIKYIPLAVILALAISLYECFFILPHHLASWVGPESFNKRSFLTPVREFWDRTITESYVKALGWCLRFRYLLVTAMTVVFFGTLMFAFKRMSFVLFPKEGVEQFIIKAEAPVGTPLERTSELIRAVEEEIAKIPRSEMDDYTTTVGIQSIGPSDPETKRGSHYAQVRVFLKPETERNRKTGEIVASVREQIGRPEGFERFTVDIVGAGPPVGQAINIGVNGETYEEIIPAVNALKEIVKSVSGTTDVTDSFVKGKDEIRVIVNDEEAAAAGLSVAAVGSSVRAAYEGIVATSIRRLDEEIDVRVSLPLEERTDRESLKRIRIPNAQGALVPLDRVASFEDARSVSQYAHERNTRQVRVLGNVDESRTSSNEVNRTVMDSIPQLQAQFPNVNFSFGGEFEDTAESFDSLKKAAFTAVLGIFLILVLLFENILQPFLVILTIPLGVLAVLWAFAIHGMPLSFLGMIGMVALAGVIVNNSIVLIDFVNKERAGGMGKTESIIEAGRKRIRPIFLTTMTTVFGILPTAYGIGGLDQFVVPVAMALGWGLFFGSVLAVFIFPSLLAIQDDFAAFARRIFRKSKTVS